MSWEEEWEGFPEDEWPVVVEDERWTVERVHRLTAWENRPGQTMFYINIKNERGDPVGGVRIRFETEPSETGVIYDHPDIWGRTGTLPGREGYAEWNHYGIPTRYRMVVGTLSVENLRTDLGNEYPISRRGGPPVSYVPTNRPGQYSYKIDITRREEP